MNRNAILDNLDDIPISANVSVPFSSTVSAPISTPSLIETNINNESFLQQLLSNKIYIYIIIGIIYILNIFINQKKKNQKKKNQKKKNQKKRNQKKKQENILYHLILNIIY